MLTERNPHARPIADRDDGPGRDQLLELHRRVELLVALCVLVAVTILVLAAEPAGAQQAVGTLR